MNLRRLIGYLLAVAVIVGLVAAPLVLSPAAAKGLPVGQISDMAAMSRDMPCGPDGQKNKNWQDCPLVAMRMLTKVLAEPALTNSIQVHFLIRKLSFELEDLRADGLIDVCPEQLPLTL